MAEEVVMDAPMPMVLSKSLAIHPVSELAKPTRVRKLFPETWLWKSQEALYVYISVRQQ